MKRLLTAFFLTCFLFLFGGFDQLPVQADQDDAGYSSVLLERDGRAPLFSGDRDQVAILQKAPSASSKPSTWIEPTVTEVEEEEVSSRPLTSSFVSFLTSNLNGSLFKDYIKVNSLPDDNSYTSSNRRYLLIQVFRI